MANLQEDNKIFHEAANRILTNLKKELHATFEQEEAKVRAEYAQEDAMIKATREAEDRQVLQARLEADTKVALERQRKLDARQAARKLEEDDYLQHGLTITLFSACGFPRPKVISAEVPNEPCTVITASPKPALDPQPPQSTQSQHQSSPSTTLAMHNFKKSQQSVKAKPAILVSSTNGTSTPQNTITQISRTTTSAPSSAPRKSLAKSPRASPASSQSQDRIAELSTREESMSLRKRKRVVGPQKSSSSSSGPALLSDSDTPMDPRADSSDYEG